MPMHDWSRVTPGVWHNFHYRWIAAIIDRLNAGMLPEGMIAMAEQVISADVERYAAKANRVVVRHALGKVVAVIELVSPGNKDSRHALRSFVEKSVDLLYDHVNLLVIDPFPPGNRDPQGIHKAIWDEISDNSFTLPDGRPLTLAAYQAAPVVTAFVEPISVGQHIPDMPLFLHNNYYINVPLEATYMDSWSVLPQLLRDLVL